MTAKGGEQPTIGRRVARQRCQHHRFQLLFLGVHADILIVRTIGAVRYREIATLTVARPASSEGGSSGVERHDFRTGPSQRGPVAEGACCRATRALVADAIAAPGPFGPPRVWLMAEAPSTSSMRPFAGCAAFAARNGVKHRSAGAVGQSVKCAIEARRSLHRFLRRNESWDQRRA